MSRIGVAYLLVALLVALVIADRVPNGAASYHAARALAVNHRIVTTDLKFTCDLCRILDPDLPTQREFEGRYVKERRDPDTAIGLDDTLPQPVFTSHTGALLVWLALGDTPPTDLAAIDVGAKVEACGFSDPKHPCMPGLKVAAVSCDEKQPQTCSVGVWVAGNAKSVDLAVLAATKTNPPQRLRLFVQQ